MGDPLPDSLVRATMAARANVLATATTGCRPEAAEVLISMLNKGVTPTVPSQGSVGAAGDLAPLAHIARVACGYTDRPASIPAYVPNPKEALALINGISMTTALGAVAVTRARRVLDSAIAACAMTMEAVGAGPAASMTAFSPRGIIPVRCRWVSGFGPCCWAASKCLLQEARTPSPFAEHPRLWEP